ncbi:MAG: hypothetical protein ACI9F9_002972, partial [Candidatus Paceibacteria bacterium]
MAELTEQNLKDVLFARAFEPSGDPAGVLSKVDADAASRRARVQVDEVDPAASPTDFMVRRAKLLCARVEELQPHWAVWRAGAVWKGPALWLVLTISIAIGLAVDRLGESGRINLLSFPVLGLMLWNLGVYALILISPLLQRKAAGESEGAASRRAAAGGVARALLWLASPERLWRARDAASGKGEAMVAAQRYLRDWMRIGSVLHWKRLQVSMHVAAMGIMAGTIAGMYLRGLVLHYEASWESTFLSASAVHAFLGALFAPAASQLGSSVPDLATIESLRAPQGSGPAAFWIHAWALTGFWLVIVPRAGLALFSSWRAKRLSRRVSFDLEGDAYFLKLLSADRGQGARAYVQTYSFAPSTRASDGLTTLLFDLLGGRTRIERLPACQYGDDPKLPQTAAKGSICQVVLFSLAQSPELEVHAAYLENMVAQLRQTNGLASVLVVLD